MKIEEIRSDVLLAASGVAKLLTGYAESEDYENVIRDFEFLAKDVWKEAKTLELRMALRMLIGILTRGESKRILAEDLQRWLHAARFRRVCVHSSLTNRLTSHHAQWEEGLELPVFVDLLVVPNGCKLPEELHLRQCQVLEVELESV